MAAFRSASLDVIVYLLVCSSEAQTNITADAGQDVILPCIVSNINITAVKWRRPEIKTEYVIFYRDGHIDPDSQHPSYQNRVDLQDKEMKDGDASLILKNVKMEDTGTYECQVFQKGTNHRKTSSSMTKTTYIINLEVYPSGNKARLIGDGGDKDGGNMVGVIGGHLGVVGVMLLHSVVSLVFF